MNLRIYLRKQKINQEQLARALGLTRQAISHKLTGRRRWTPENAKAIEEFTRGMVSRMEVLYPDE